MRTIDTSMRIFVPATLILSSILFNACRQEAPIPGAKAELSKPCCQKPLPPGKATEASLYQLGSLWKTDYGSEIELSQLRGRPQVVSMIYTHCNFACPVTMKNLKDIEGRLPADLRDRVGFLLVTMDPARDSAARLRDFRDMMELDDMRWNLLTASEQDVLEFAHLMGVKYKQEPDGEFSHSNLITVLDPDGEIAFQQVGLEQDPDPVVKALRDILRQSESGS